MLLIGGIGSAKRQGSVNGGVKVGQWGGVILGQARRFGAAASEARPSLRRSERVAAGALRLMQS